MLKLTSLPAFITTVFRGMPGVWKSQHRLLLCWLIVMQAVYPGRKTLHELARWSPGQITEWRLRRLLKASYWCVHLCTWPDEMGSSSHLVMGFLGGMSDKKLNT
jgi:hypothetical protein